MNELPPLAAGAAECCAAKATPPHERLRGKQPEQEGQAFGMADAEQQLPAALVLIHGLQVKQILSRVGAGIGPAF